MKNILFYVTFLLSTTTIWSNTSLTPTQDTLSSMLSSLATIVQEEPPQQELLEVLRGFLDNVFTLVAETNTCYEPTFESYLKKLQLESNEKLSTTFSEIATGHSKHHAKDKEKEGKTQAALCNVATIVTGVANIVQNPHDKINVGQSVGSILAGIINLAVLASHKPSQRDMLPHGNAH